MKAIHNRHTIIIIIYLKINCRQIKRKQRWNTSVHNQNSIIEKTTNEILLKKHYSLHPISWFISLIDYKQDNTWQKYHENVRFPR